MSLVVATIASVLASPRVANAETVRVTGTITETAPGTCSLPVLTGTVGRIECVGLEETWTGGLSGIGVFDETILLNLRIGRGPHQRHRDLHWLCRFQLRGPRVGI